MTSQKINKYIAPLSLLSGLGHGATIIATSWWLKSVGISYKEIGLFSLANAAYGFTFVWIPILDKLDLKKFLKTLGFEFNQSIQRKGFILISVSLTAIGIFIASFSNPNTNLMSLAIPIAFAGFWLATADAVMLAYVYETLNPTHMGVSTAAYRLGIFASSACLLFIHEVLSVPWPLMLQIISFLLLILMSSLFFAPQEKEAKLKKWREAFILPYYDLLKTYKFSLISIILFISAYKMHDRFIAPMEQMFLRDKLGVYAYFILKAVSTFALSFSAIKSGPLLKRYNYKNSFYISIIGSGVIVLCYYLCTLLNHFMNLLCIFIGGTLISLFYYLIDRKKQYLVIGGLITISTLIIVQFGFLNQVYLVALCLTVIAAKMISGIRNSMLMSYSTSLCSKEYALTQTSLMVSVEKLILGFWMQGSSGFFVEKFGWSGFYFIAIVLSLCPIIFISLLQNPAGKSN